MGPRLGLACGVGAPAACVADTSPLAVSTVCQAGDCLAQAGTTVDLAPGAAVLSLLQAIVRRGADAGPADREGAVVVRGRRRQRWWIGGWIRPHSRLDRRE